MDASAHGGTEATIVDEPGVVDDVLNELLRYDEILGVIAVSIGMIAGSIVGLFAGYFGRWFDMVSQRVIDVMLAFPDLILALAIVAVLGPSLSNVMIAIAS